jgi:L-asparaginase
MRTVYVITTGGTIEKVYSEQEGAVLNSVSKVERYLKHLRLPDCEVRVLPLMNKDSLEMTAQDRRHLAAELTSLLPHGHPVVIIHGTDTMIETGVYIQKLFEHHLKVPVILTGAMTPLGFEGSDGLQNLTESLLVARLLRSGVFIVFHGKIHRAHKARKDRERGTFVSIPKRLR